MTARDDIEAVAGGVLAGHRIVFQSDGDYGELQWIECTCDYEQRDNWTGDTEADHDAHVAAVLAEALAPMVAEVRAEHGGGRLCDNRGPRIGEDCPRCRRPLGHTGVHQNVIEDGFGSVISW
jgi:hypothetical protein